MKIETLEVSGFKTALTGMRNPWDSWARSDSTILLDDVETSDTPEYSMILQTMKIGEKDRALSMQLQRNGPEHCKHLRMIHASANITAPRYWWQQMDCYRYGVEKISCSTMHTLMRRKLTPDDFEPCNGDCVGGAVLETMQYINGAMETYLQTEDPAEKRKLWEYVIQALPQSFLQKRTVQFSYAALRNIYRQRKGHKLSTWQEFRGWCESLPESWMITD